MWPFCYFRLPYLIEVRMQQRLSGSYPICRVHLQAAFHKPNRSPIQLTEVASVQRLDMVDLWHPKPSKHWISLKQLLLLVRHRTN
jgi:hypothetical protein